ncbi:MAG TPA: hypothetical protein VMV75_11340 [Sulfuricella sp.]|nr:hypothetical protein [Sulfuricella sp.]
MDIIFLIYGLSFVVLGLAIFVLPREKSRFNLVGFIWLLAVFGIIHGFLEWMDLWTRVRGENPSLNAAKPFVLLVSYLFLVEFGRRLVRDSLPATVRSSAARWLLDARIHVFLLGGTLVAATLSDNFLQALVIWSRYLLGFPGSTLAGAGFLLYYRFRIQPTLTQRKFLSIQYACYVAAFAFIAYGIFGGLVVPRAPWFPADWLNQEDFLEVLGAPVQLFRAVCAVLVAISVTHILLELSIHDLTHHTTAGGNE